MIACAPFFYYSIYRLGRAIAKKRSGEIDLWSLVLLGATVLPYLYVLFFGYGLPWYVYVVLAAFLGQSLWSLVRRRRRIH